MKKVVAVAPYCHGINFKMQVYDAWVKAGGKTMHSHYPCKLFHGFAFRFNLPSLSKNRNIAQLRFVEAVSLNFDTFPDYSRYEIIPLVWDCWPIRFDDTCRWFEKHQVRTAIFTSSQVADRMRERFPSMNILTITEGIDTEKYAEGKLLNERKTDVLEFGRKNYFFEEGLPDGINHICSNGARKMFATDDEFHAALMDAKMTVCIPKCMMNPQTAGDIETLTQRYWEAMLSRIIIIGKAPRELIDLIGYNPVIEVDKENAEAKVMEILNNINDYQQLVDKNRKVALSMSSWSLRINQIKEWLSSIGEYDCK